MTQPEPTVDDIRAAIRANPQSQADRQYLITKAVEMDIAGEIPNDWTVEFYDDEFDWYDETDAIEDSYKFDARVMGGNSTVVGGVPVGGEMKPTNTAPVSINAHSSGSMSISFPPELPDLKFDLATADRLIEMFTAAELAVLQYRVVDPNAAWSEPTTGISITALPGTEYPDFNVLNIGRRVFRLKTSDFDDWTVGLTSMANSAETFGLQGEE